MMADLFQQVAAEMEGVKALHDRQRRLRTMRDALWARLPWRLIPKRPRRLRRRAFAWYAERHFDAS